MLHRTARKIKKNHVRVLGRGNSSKSKLQSPPQTGRHRKPTKAVVKRLRSQTGSSVKKKVLELDQIPGSSYRELKRFVTDRSLFGKPSRIALMLWEFHPQSQEF